MSQIIHSKRRFSYRARLRYLPHLTSKFDRGGVFDSIDIYVYIYIQVLF